MSALYHLRLADQVTRWTGVLLALLVCALAPANAFAQQTVAIARFKGVPVEQATVVSDILYQELLQSPALMVLEPAQFIKGARAVSIANPAIDALTPEQAAALKEELDADLLVLGSGMTIGQEITLYARVIDLSTGRVKPGWAVKASGPANTVGDAAMKLATQLLTKIAPVEPSIPPSPGDNSDGRPSTVPANTAEAARFAELAVQWVTRQGWLSAGTGGRFASDAVIATPDFAGILARIRKTREANDPKVDITEKGPISALRATICLIRMKAEPAELERADVSVLPDPEALVDWSRKPLAWAIRRGIFASPAEAPDVPLTRRQCAVLLTRFFPPLPADAFEPNDQTAYTCLIVDARGLKMSRSMAPTITDQSNRRIYPDPINVPPHEYLMENGIVQYTTSVDQARELAGQHPLTVKAAKRSNRRDGVIVTNEIGDQILMENRKAFFLSRCRVIFVIDAAPAPKPADTEPAEPEESEVVPAKPAKPVKPAVPDEPVEPEPPEHPMDDTEQDG